MRFLLIAFSAALLVINTLDAQHLNTGIKGGVNFYNIANTNSSNGEPVPGFHLGLVVHYHISNQFALQPEVVFSTQGIRLHNGGIESQLNMNYINVPVLVQYRFDKGFRIFTGPQVGFVSSATGTTFRDL